MDLEYSAYRHVSNPQLAIVLGSGVRCQFSDVQESVEIDYVELGDFPQPTVQGHKGVLTVHKHARGFEILQFNGRFHLYEGRAVAEVQSIMRFLRGLSVPRILITNAAGGISDQLNVTDLMLIDSVKNYQIPVASEQGLLGNLSTPKLTIDSALHESIASLFPALKQGCYAAVLGPNYETDAEIELFRAQGCDAVGMSTYLELLYAMEHGMNVAAISVITNSWAQKQQAEQPTHQEVLDNSRLAQHKLQGVLDALVSDIAS